jgi:hypothetical protein
LPNQDTGRGEKPSGKKNQEMNDFQLRLGLHIRHERLALGGVTPLLQGGAAVGADQDGVYAALGEGKFHLHWTVAQIGQLK